MKNGVSWRLSAEKIPTISIGRLKLGLPKSQEPRYWLFLYREPQQQIAYWIALPLPKTNKRSRIVLVKESVDFALPTLGRTKIKKEHTLILGISR